MKTHELVKELIRMIASEVPSGDYEIKCTFRKGANPLTIGDCVRCSGVIVNKIEDSMVLAYLPFQIDLEPLSPISNQT